MAELKVPEVKVPDSEFEITVFLRGYLEEPIPLGCDLSTSVADLKKRILEKVRAKEFDSMHVTLWLVFAGKLMNSNKNLAFYGVQDGSHIVVSVVTDMKKVPRYLLPKLDLPLDAAPFPPNADPTADDHRAPAPPHPPAPAPAPAPEGLRGPHFVGVGGNAPHAAPPPNLAIDESHVPPVPPPELSALIQGVPNAVALPNEEEEDLTAMLDELEIMTSPTGRDMLTLMRQESGKSPRYIMPCDHIISAQSLTSFAKNEINGPALPIEVQCPEPSCEANWPYPLIRKVAGLSAEQMGEFEVKLSENLIERKMDVASCPKCKTLLARKRLGILLATCAACYIESKKPFYFCWKCRSEWTTSGDPKICGNEICTFSERKLRDDVLEILKDCKKKKIGSVEGVPEYRACPKCGQLINHIDACKHMSCTRRRCNTNFCFVCLALYSGSWPCGGYNDACPLADVQNDLTLPKWKRTGEFNFG